MITDIHFGARANAVEWMEIQRDYFENFFIPLVEKNYRPGDILLVLGDIFDSRNALNLMVLNMGLDIFEKLSKIFKEGIVIILGNHDCYLKSSNEINSVKVLRFIPNIHIYEEPKSVTIGNRKFLLMPWRKNAQDERDCILSMGTGHDYLLMHTDVKGFKHNRTQDITTGCEISLYRPFKRVYSGHIHYAQRVANINMLGSPYEITRSDRGNMKGVTVLDLASGDETFYENTHSPKFVVFNFVDVIEMTPAKLKKAFKNNFVDILIDNENIIKAPLSILVDLLDNNYRALEFKMMTEFSKLPDDPASAQYKEFDMQNAMSDYVNAQAFDTDTKTSLLNALLTLYKQAEQNQLIENAD
jgi:DNA repair exonuclease SbcCD nuclease subunit